MHISDKSSEGEIYLIFASKIKFIYLSLFALQIRTAMIVALSNQKSTSLEAMRQNADVMASLTKSKGEVTAESQESSAGSLMGMAGQLSGESSDEDGAGSDAVESTAGTMASGLGNLIGSAAGSAKAKVSKQKLL